MELNRKLVECLASKAESVWIDQLSIGLGYTAVTTSDGGIGIAATGTTANHCCNDSLGATDCEGRPAIDLLMRITDREPMARTIALATINALNHQRALQLPEDNKNMTLFDRFGILSGARVAMVGYFPPLVDLFKEKQVPLTVIDDARGIGHRTDFYKQLKQWAEVLLITATTIINNTTETILAHAGPSLQAVMLGPSTPMVPDAFNHLPIRMLAGTAVTDPEKALKLVRHGGGARSLKPVSRKVYCLAGTDNRSS